MYIIVYLLKQSDTLKRQTEDLVELPSPVVTAPVTTRQSPGF